MSAEQAALVLFRLVPLKNAVIQSDDPELREEEESKDLRLFFARPNKNHGCPRSRF